MKPADNPEAGDTSASSKGSFTPKQIAEIVARSMESDAAERVLEALRAIDGQPITPRLLDKLPGGRVEWRLSRALGWTEIKNRAYLSSGGKHREAVQLLLAHSESVVPLSADFVERENKEYFKERRERNALREKALADPVQLERLAALFSELDVINKARTQCRKRFAAFVAPGEPFSPARFDLERACGLREDKK